MLHLQCWHHHRAALLSKVRRVEILMVLSNWEYECYMFIISSFKPKSFKHLFSTSNFTSTLLNCSVLEHRDFKTKQLRSVLVKLLVLN